MRSLPPKGALFILGRPGDEKGARVGRLFFGVAGPYQTTASSFSFFTFTNCSRFMPSQIASGLATSTEE